MRVSLRQLLERGRLADLQPGMARDEVLAAMGHAAGTGGSHQE